MAGRNVDSPSCNHVNGYLGISGLLHGFISCGYKSRAKQYYEAADVDGATEWQKFRFITLPQIHYMTVFIIVINTIRSWQVFPEVFTLTRGGPLGSTDTLVHRLYEAAFRFQEMGYASALSYVLFAIILTLSLLQMRVLGRTR